MFKVRKPPPDARILKMRQYEDKLHDLCKQNDEQVRQRNISSNCLC